MDEQEELLIGVDLGTTNCVMAYYDTKANAAVTIKTSLNSDTTPSVVGFTADGQQVVGEAAKDQMSSNAANTVYDVKRLIGRDFDDASVQEDMKYWPFRVVRHDASSKAMVQIEVNNESKQLKPEDISAIVLKELKSTAELYSKRPVKRAVVTVPAYFSQAQRQATHDAATAAGLEVLELIHEPTAAALAYGLENVSSAERNVLVFDFGGGTLDVTVLTVRDRTTFEVKSTHGVTHLGGVDLDHCIVNYLIDDFKAHHDVDLATDAKAMRRLQVASEKAKQMLSTLSAARVELDALSEANIDYTCNVSRAAFEEAAKSVFDKILEPVQIAIQQAKLDKQHIDEVALVGGSSRVPKVQALLADFFGGKQLKKNVNPAVAVAHGAAAWAMKLGGATAVGKQLPYLTLVEVSSHSLGIEINDGDMNVLVPKNSKLPAEAKRSYTNQLVNQTECHISVYTGEEKKTGRNSLLGEFTLSGIPAFQLHEADIEVTMKIDSSNMVHITAVEKSTGKSNTITVEQLIK